MAKVEVVGRRGNWSILYKDNNHWYLLDNKILTKYTAERLASFWRKDIKKTKIPQDYIYKH